MLMLISTTAHGQFNPYPGTWMKKWNRLSKTPIIGVDTNVAMSNLVVSGIFTNIFTNTVGVCFSISNGVLTIDSNCFGGVVTSSLTCASITDALASCCGTGVCCTTTDLCISVTDHTGGFPNTFLFSQTPAFNCTNFGQCLATNWTYEFWIKGVIQIANGEWLADFGGSSAELKVNARPYDPDATKFAIVEQLVNTPITLTYTNVVPTNSLPYTLAPLHLAVQQSNGVYTLYYNGAVVNAVTGTIQTVNLNGVNSEIRMQTETATGPQVQMNEARFSSTNRYTAAGFTPANRFCTDAQTVELYHFDDSNMVYATDSSGNGLNLTNGAGCQVSCTFQSYIVWTPGEVCATNQTGLCLESTNLNISGQILYFTNGILYGLSGTFLDTDTNTQLVLTNNLILTNIDGSITMTNTVLAGRTNVDISVANPWTKDYNANNHSLSNLSSMTVTGTLAPSAFQGVTINNQSTLNATFNINGKLVPVGGVTTNQGDLLVQSSLLTAGSITSQGKLTEYGTVTPTTNWDVTANPGALVQGNNQMPLFSTNALVSNLAGQGKIISNTPPITATNIAGVNATVNTNGWPLGGLVITTNISLTTDNNGWCTNYFAMNNVQNAIFNPTNGVEGGDAIVVWAHVVSIVSNRVVFGVITTNATGIFTISFPVVGPATAFGN